MRGEARELATQAGRGAAGAASRRGIYLLLAACLLAAAVAVVIAVLFFSSRADGELSAQPRLQGALRPGSPGFEEALAGIHVEAARKGPARVVFTERLVELTTIVRNETGRTLRGLEVRAVMVGEDGSPLVEGSALPVPEQQTRLEPGEAMEVRVRLSRPREAREAAAHVEVTGVLFD